MRWGYGREESLAAKRAKAQRPVPDPTVMPVDRAEWARQLHRSNFVNSFCQYRDLLSLGGCTQVLIIGPGQGLDTQVLRWRRFNVTTVDIDGAFSPDVIASVHEMPMFASGEFDAVVASHVLEHLPEPHLDSALAEIARIGRYALIYLPVHGLSLQLRVSSNWRGLDFSAVLDVFNYFRKPDGITPRYMEGQHFWEIGMRGYSVRALTRRMRQHFDVLSIYRNRDWTASQNWVLKSRGADSSVV